MSDNDEADPELVELLRAAFIGQRREVEQLDSGVLRDAEYVYDNSIDVAIDTRATKAAAEDIFDQLQKDGYSTKTWSAHELHPQAKDESTVAFIFTMDLLNFSFWSELPESERFAIKYQGRIWTGYTSLVAALQRAIDEGLPITSPDFWRNEGEFDEEVMSKVFRSHTPEPMPLLSERLECLREAGAVLHQKYASSFLNCVAAADHSAVRLVNLLARDFPCFRDEVSFEDRKKVRFLKRAQIVVADLWACFNGEGFGKFYDIAKITTFADYRVPQILFSLGCLTYSPVLEVAIRARDIIPSGHPWEIQLRGCTIWCIELLRQHILRQHPEAVLNSILIDFFLYDKMKEQERLGIVLIPHHRTRSIWY